MPMVPVQQPKMESLPVRIARTVREEREARGWSQARLAVEAGVCRATVLRVEAGEVGSIYIIDAICRALEVSLRLGG